MSKFTVLSPVKHDRRRYAIGDTIAISDAAAKPLLDAGVIGVSVPSRAPAAHGPVQTPAPPDPALSALPWERGDGEGEGQPPAPPAT